MTQRTFVFDDGEHCRQTSLGNPGLCRRLDELTAPVSKGGEGL